jgi:O-antigen/teichoic acid export membrane protein
MMMRLRRSSGFAGLSWGLIDQGFSSATNLGLSVIAGRAAGPGGLGVVFLGFAAYLMILTMQRALVTEPLVVASASHSAEERASAARNALAIVITGAVVASALLLLIGLLIPAPDGPGLVVFVPWLGSALVQDFWRAVLFRDGRGAAAALNDGLWAAVMILTIPLILVSRDPWIVVLTWGAGALAGGAIGFVQTGLRPANLRASMRWWVGHAWPLARYFAPEALLLVIQLQFGIFALAIILGTADVGGLRSVQAVFAPMTLLTQAIAFPGLPMLTKLSGQSRRLARGWALRLSALAVALVLAYLLAVALFPHHLLGVIFGPDFDRFDDLIPPVAVLQLLLAGSLGFAILLKAEGRGRALLASRAIGAMFTGVLTITLALASGLTAATWGMTIAWATGAVSTTVLALWPTRGHDRALHAAASAADALPGQSLD